MRKPATVFLFLLPGLLGDALTSQEIPVGDVPGEQLEYRTYLEKRVLATDSGRVLRPREYRIGDLTHEKGKGFVDSEVAIRFIRDRKPLPVSIDYLKALIHNVETSRIWRLRRARFERVSGKEGLWEVKELVFGYRQEDADREGVFLPLPKARPATWRFAKMITAKEEDQITFRSMAFDMTARQPLLTAEIEVLGEGYRKRFFGVESAIAAECTKPDGVFRDVRWGGGEQPVAGKIGGVFTLELRIRRRD